MDLTNTFTNSLEQTNMYKGLDENKQNQIKAISRGYDEYLYNATLDLENKLNSIKKGVEGKNNALGTFLQFIPTGWVYSAAKGIFNGITDFVLGLGQMGMKLINDIQQVGITDYRFGEGEETKEAFADLGYALTSPIIDIGTSLLQGANSISNIINTKVFRQNKTIENMEFNRKNKIIQGWNEDLKDLILTGDVSSDKSKEQTQEWVKENAIEMAQASDWFKENVNKKIANVMSFGTGSAIESNGRNAWSKFFDSTVESVGRMVPAIAAAYLPLPGNTAKLASEIYFFSSSFGSAFEEALQNGATVEEAYNYGYGSASVESLTEAIGGIKIGEVLPSGAKGLNTILKSMVEEGSEEVYSEVVSKGLEGIYKSDVNNEDIMSRAIMSFLGGALSGGFLTGVGQATRSSTFVGKSEKVEDTLDKLLKTEKGDYTKAQTKLNDLTDRMIEAFNNTNVLDGISIKDQGLEESDLLKAKKQFLEDNPVSQTIIQFNDKTNKFEFTEDANAMRNDLSGYLQGRYKGELINKQNLAVSKYRSARSNIPDNIEVATMEDIEKIENKEVREQIKTFLNSKASKDIVLFDKNISQEDLATGFILDKENDNNIYININKVKSVDDFFTRVLSHETIHRMRKYNPKAYQNLINYIKKDENGVIEDLMKNDKVRNEMAKKEFAKQRKEYIEDLESKGYDKKVIEKETNKYFNKDVYEKEFKRKFFSEPFSTTLENVYKKGDRYQKLSETSETLAKDYLEEEKLAYYIEHIFVNEKALNKMIGKMPVFGKGIKLTSKNLDIMTEQELLDTINKVLEENLDLETFKKDETLYKQQAKEKLGSKKYIKSKKFDKVANLFGQYAKQTNEKNLPLQQLVNKYERANIINAVNKGTQQTTYIKVGKNVYKMPKEIAGFFNIDDLKMSREASLNEEHYRVDGKNGYSEYSKKELKEFFDLFAFNNLDDNVDYIIDNLLKDYIEENQLKMNDGNFDSYKTDIANYKEIVGTKLAYIEAICLNNPFIYQEFKTRAIERINKLYEDLKGAKGIFKKPKVFDKELKGEDRENFSKSQEFAQREVLEITDPKLYREFFTLNYIALEPRFAVSVSLLPSEVYNVEAKGGMYIFNEGRGGFAVGNNKVIKNFDSVYNNDLRNINDGEIASVFNSSDIKMPKSFWQYITQALKVTNISATNSKLSNNYQGWGFELNEDGEFDYSPEFMSEWSNSYNNFLLYCAKLNMVKPVYHSLTKEIKKPKKVKEKVAKKEEKEDIVPSYDEMNLEPKGEIKVGEGILSPHYIDRIDMRGDLRPKERELINKILKSDTISKEDFKKYQKLYRLSYKNDRSSPLEDDYGRILTPKQVKRNKGNKLVDKYGRLLNLYHGSKNGGFMTFNYGKKRAIFLTPSREVAESYSLNDRDVFTRTFKTTQEVFDWFYEEEHEGIDLQDMDLYKGADSNYLKEEIERYKQYFDEKGINEKNEKFYKAKKEYLETILKKGYVVELRQAEVDSELDEDDDTIYGIYFENAKDLRENIGKEIQDYIQSWETMWNEQDEYGNPIPYEEYEYEDDDRKNPDYQKRPSIYNVYGYAKNPIIINARGNNFMNIPFRGEFMRTDDIAKIIMDEGVHDGIIFRNILDNGEKDFNNDLGINDGYVVFEPNQVKSVDNKAPTDDESIIRSYDEIDLDDDLDILDYDEDYEFDDDVYTYEEIDASLPKKSNIEYKDIEDYNDIMEYYYDEDYDFSEKALKEVSYKNAFKDLTTLDEYGDYDMGDFKVFVRKKLEYEKVENLENAFDRIIDNYSRKTNFLKKVNEERRRIKVSKKANRKFRSPGFVTKNLLNNIEAFRNSGKQLVYSKERMEGLSKYNEKRYAYTMMISPQEFLELTLYVKRKQFYGNYLDEVKPLDLKELQQKESMNAEMILLEFDTKTGEVTDHNGRHRMYALMEEGFTNVQILLIPVRHSDGQMYREWQGEVPPIPKHLLGQTFNEERGRTTSLEIPTIKVERLIDSNIDNIEKEFNKDNSDYLYSYTTFRKRFSNRDFSFGKDVVWEVEGIGNAKIEKLANGEIKLTHETDTNSEAYEKTFKNLRELNNFITNSNPKTIQKKKVIQNTIEAKKYGQRFKFDRKGFGEMAQVGAISEFENLNKNYQYGIDIPKYKEYISHLTNKTNSLNKNSIAKKLKPLGNPKEIKARTKIINKLIEKYRDIIDFNHDKSQLYNHIFNNTIQEVINALSDGKSTGIELKKKLADAIEGSLINSSQYIDEIFNNSSINKENPHNPMGYQYTKEINWLLRDIANAKTEKELKEIFDKHSGSVNSAANIVMDLLESVNQLDFSDKKTIDEFEVSLDDLRKSTNVDQVNSLEMGGMFGRTLPVVLRQHARHVDFILELIGEKGLLKGFKLFNDNDKTWLDMFGFGNILSMFTDESTGKVLTKRLFEGQTKQLKVLNFFYDYWNKNKFLKEHKKEINNLEKEKLKLDNLVDRNGNAMEIPYSEAIVLRDMMVREFTRNALIEKGYRNGDKSQYFEDGRSVFINGNIGDRVGDIAIQEQTTIKNVQELFNELNNFINSNTFVKEYNDKVLDYFNELYRYENQAFKENNGLELTNDGITLKELKDKGVDLSNLVKGIDLTNAPNIYVPLRSTQNNSQGTAGAFEIRNVMDLGVNDGMVVGIIDNNYPPIVDSVNDLVAKYSRSVANFYGMYRVVRDMNILFTQPIHQENGNDITLATKMNQISPTIIPYYEKLVRDITGYTLQQDLTASKFNKLMGDIRRNFFKASLALNFKVILTQFSSLLTVANIYGNKIGINKLTAKMVKNLFVKDSDTKAQYLLENSEIYKDRARNSTYEISEATKQNSLIKDKFNETTEFLMKGISYTDNMINKALFISLVESGYSNEEALRITEEAITRYQSGGLAINKNELLRTRHEVIKVFTKFLGEPTKVISNMLESYKYYKVQKAISNEENQKKIKDTYSNKLEEIKQKYEKQVEVVDKLKEKISKAKPNKKAELKEQLSEELNKKNRLKDNLEDIDYINSNIDKFINNVVSQKEEQKKLFSKRMAALGSALALQVAIGVGFSLLRGGARDKDDDEAMWKYLSDLTLKQMVEESVGYLPFVRDFYNLVVKQYDANAISEFDAINDLGIYMGSMLKDIVNGGEFEYGKHIRNISLHLGRALGVPTRQIERLFTVPASFLKKDWYYSYREATGQRISSNKELEKAIANGDEELIKTIISKKMKEKSVPITTITSGEINRLAKNGVIVSLVGVPDAFKVDGVEYTNDKEKFSKVYQNASNVVDKIIKTGAYKKLNEEYKGKLIQAVYNYYYTLAKQEVSKEELLPKDKVFTVSQAYKYFVHRIPSYYKEQRKAEYEARKKAQKKGS